MRRWDCKRGTWGPARWNSIHNSQFTIHNWVSEVARCGGTMWGRGDPHSMEAGAVHRLALSRLFRRILCVCHSVRRFRYSQPPLRQFKDSRLLTRTSLVELKVHFATRHVLRTMWGRGDPHSIGWRFPVLRTMWGSVGLRSIGAGAVKRCECWEVFGP